MSYNKLVRDKIPEIIEAENKKPIFRTLDDEEYIVELERKLYEETNEYLESESIEELADILEIVYSLCEANGQSIHELEKICNAKRENRGGFSKRIFLIDEKSEESEQAEIDNLLKENRELKATIQKLKLKIEIYENNPQSLKLYADKTWDKEKYYDIIGDLFVNGYINEEEAEQMYDLAERYTLLENPSAYEENELKKGYWIWDEKYRICNQIKSISINPEIETTIEFEFPIIDKNGNKHLIDAFEAGRYFPISKWLRYRFKLDLLDWIDNSN